MRRGGGFWRHHARRRIKARRQPDPPGMTTPPLLTVRDSEDADLPAISAIYGHWVLHGLASFELEPPEEAEMARRRQAVRADGFPYLVAVDAAGAVRGYAYASHYRTRPA